MNKDDLRSLSYRERTIIALRFGLNKEQARYSRSEVAKILKTTVGRVRSIEQKGLKKLADSGVSIDDGDKTA